MGANGFGEQQKNEYKKCNLSVNNKFWFIKHME